MLKIEVFPENVSVITRTIKPKDDKPGREIFEQEAYAYLGGKFPVQMKLQLEKGQQPYSAGVYTPHSSSYVINNFGGLELKKFGMIIEPLEVDL
ncbi:single-stranded DNA-binding protein [Vibrio furnissii]|uniref:single-stranded DNA-binding protein n=1 Tax=Vibrio furnissii TaxID=29494 RepID=UPI001C9DE5FB|nr:single-stranded DNA-binding protein [Vibrio furnissii]MBY7781096.1 G5P family DNA-binding protein [Vibrio fluvialis]MBY7814394.1 G5P family DNA-binding protein [Vibrio fluvialis]UHJ61625.1 G5P family DNA-binding protein [Vibrio furnissii]UHJ61629.1 G5P family DNA-binding protein [Vibrio furnissii]